MYYQKKYPVYLHHSELDNYLANGWYRMGQTIFTCRFIIFNQEMYSTIWLRLPLNNFTLKKRLRKIKRQNNERFTTKIGKATFTKEKNDLYYKHELNRFGVVYCGSLQESLLDNRQRSIYDTYEVCVYDGDRLVGVSFFDVGESSVASIMGLYDPDYSRHSLGLYTMLLEMDFAQKQQMDFYYPGYFVPGYPRFDYKLRIGDLEYFEPITNTWIDINELNLDQLPVDEVKSNLWNLHLCFEVMGAKPAIYLVNFIETERPPMMLVLPKKNNIISSGDNFYIFYLPDTKEFEVVHAHRPKQTILKTASIEETLKYSIQLTNV